MPMTAFEAALPFVLRWEGGFVDHPTDPGGRTNSGVTQDVYDDWRRRHGLLRADVREIEETEVHAIYESGYWMPPRCDLLAAHARSRAVRHRGQHGCRAAPCVSCSGRSAAASTATSARRRERGGRLRHGRGGRAVLRCSRSVTTASSRLAEPELGVFLKGWLNRLNALRQGGRAARLRSGRRSYDFGDADYVARIPDIGEDRDYDF